MRDTQKIFKNPRENSSGPHTRGDKRKSELTIGIYTIAYDGDSEEGADLILNDPGERWGCRLQVVPVKTRESCVLPNGVKLTVESCTAGHVVLRINNPERLPVTWGWPREAKCN